MGVEAKKFKRNHRIVFICQYLMEHPNQLVTLSFFADYFDSAKSSISEDINFVRDVFQENDLGDIRTVAGVSGGIIFYPTIQERDLKDLFHRVARKMESGKRVLPGNYIYMGDVLQDSDILNRLGKLIASRYQRSGVDAVMTIETKGIGLAVAVARYLNVPHVVVRRDSRDAEGSTISISYLSGSLQTVNKMELSKLALAPRSKVLIVDDFLRNGGTIFGLLSMLDEFECQLAGVCVFAENTDQEKQKLPPHESLMKIQMVYNPEIEHFELYTEPGSFFTEGEAFEPFTTSLH